MRNFIFQAASIALIAMPVFASAQESGKSPDSISAEVLDKLRAGEYLAAITIFFAANPLAASKTAEFGYLSDQMASSERAYGRISQCEQIDREALGTLIESRTYLCQHRDYVTRWVMSFQKTGKGWVGANIRFDDRTLELLSNGIGK
jgi:hypothetical protein